MMSFYEKPLHLNVEITGWCNQKCIYCFNDSQANRKHLVKNIEDWYNLLSILKNNGLNSIHITGGEPFGYPKILELLEVCMEHHLSTSVLSNGFRIASLCKQHPKLFSNLVKAQISLDTLDCELLRVRRGSIKAYTDAMSAIYALRDLDVPLELSVVLDNETTSGINKLKEFCNEIDASILLRYTEQTGRAEKTRLSNLDFISYEEKKGTEEHVFVEDEFCYLPSLRLDGLTKGIWTVEYNGNVSPKPFYVEDRLFDNIHSLLRKTA